MNQHFTKFILLISSVLVLSCKPEYKPSLDMTRDSIMHKYFAAIDSFTYFEHQDTLNGDFKLLRAYYEKDTSYLRKTYKTLLRSMRTWDEFDIPTKCAVPA